MQIKPASFWTLASLTTPANGEGSTGFIRAKEKLKVLRRVFPLEKNLKYQLLKNFGDHHVLVNSQFLVASNSLTQKERLGGVDFFRH